MLSLNSKDVNLNLAVVGNARNHKFVDATVLARICVRLLPSFLEVASHTPRKAMMFATFDKLFCIRETAEGNNVEIVLIDWGKDGRGGRLMCCSGSALSPSSSGPVSGVGRIVVVLYTATILRCTSKDSFNCVQDLEFESVHLLMTG